MEGIVKGQQSHLTQYALRADALTDLTREARGTLRGCAPLGPDSPPPPTPPSLPQLLTSPPLAPPPRWPPSLPRPPPKAAPPPSTSPRLAAMLGVNLAALIVCVTCSTVTYTALLGVGPWLRRRKRRGLRRKRQGLHVPQRMFSGSRRSWCGFDALSSATYEVHLLFPTAVFFTIIGNHGARNHIATDGLTGRKGFIGNGALLTIDRPDRSHSD